MGWISYEDKEAGDLICAVISVEGLMFHTVQYKKIFLKEKFITNSNRTLAAVFLQSLQRLSKGSKRTTNEHAINGFY